MHERVSAAVLHVIKNAGYTIVGPTLIRAERDAKPCHRVDAIDNASGERWSVQTATEYDAIIELPRQVGIELED